MAINILRATLFFSPRKNIVEPQKQTYLSLFVAVIIELSNSDVQRSKFHSIGIRRQQIRRRFEFDRIIFKPILII